MIHAFLFLSLAILHGYSFSVSATTVCEPSTIQHGFFCDSEILTSLKAEKNELEAKCISACLKHGSCSSLTFYPGDSSSSCTLHSLCHPKNKKDALILQCHHILEQQTNVLLQRRSDSPSRFTRGDIDASATNRTTTTTTITTTTTTTTTKISTTITATTISTVPATRTSPDTSGMTSHSGFSTTVTDLTSSTHTNNDTPTSDDDTPSTTTSSVVSTTVTSQPERQRTRVRAEVSFRFGQSITDVQIQNLTAEIKLYLSEKLSISVTNIEVEIQRGVGQREETTVIRATITITVPEGGSVAALKGEVRSSLESDVVQQRFTQAGLDFTLLDVQLMSVTEDSNESSGGISNGAMAVMILGVLFAIVVFGIILVFLNNRINSTKDIVKYSGELSTISPRVSRTKSLLGTNNCEETSNV